MRISDWSSDVCSSDLHRNAGADRDERGDPVVDDHRPGDADVIFAVALLEGPRHQREIGRASWGKSVSVRVDLGGRRIIKKKKNYTNISRHKNTKQIDLNTQLKK